MAVKTPAEHLADSPKIDDASDLVQAALTSTEYWDNPWDDEDWNNAPAR